MVSDWLGGIGVEWLIAVSGWNVCEWYEEEKSNGG